MPFLGPVSTVTEVVVLLVDMNMERGGTRFNGGRCGDSSQKQSAADWLFRRIGQPIADRLSGEIALDGCFPLC